MFTITQERKKLHKGTNILQEKRSREWWQKLTVQNQALTGLQVVAGKENYG